MAVPQTSDELDAHLADEVDFVIDACTKYDEGRPHYAKIIATSLRKLMHDTGASHSLLGQLGLKEKWHWRDTAEEIDPANLAATFGLVSVSVTWDEAGSSSVTKYIPFLDGYPRQSLLRESAFSRTQIQRERGTPLPFTRWWNRAVIKDFTGNVFTRADLVLKVANQDGGAHIASRVSGSAYIDLSRNGSLSLPAQEADGSASLNVQCAAPATLRQIGFEVVQTVQHYRPDLLQI